MTDYIFTLEGKRIFVAGHRGMVGSAIMRRLERESATLLTVGRDGLDLTRQQDVEDWFEANRPDAVILAAAKVGGILANATYPAVFMRDNLLIATNVIDAAHRHSVDRLLFLGSSCIYPKMAPQPIEENALLSGKLETTNEAYALAKIAGLKMCTFYRQQYGRSYISLMPTNLYGPNDNFDLASSHVLPALMSKIHTAKMNGHAPVTIWGTGTPKREFLHVDDLADASAHLLQYYDGAETVNVGTGSDVSIYELAKIIADIIGFEGEFILDSTKPDGTPRKVLDVTKLKNLGWQASTALEDGIQSTYDWYLQNALKTE